jgi:hypothetical protein
MANGKYINIYALVSESEPNVLKYIGVTRRNPKNRLKSHLFEAKATPTKNKRTSWISQNSYKIQQIILDEVLEENCDYKLLEKFWISLVKSWGFTLVNSNNGGGGTLKRDENFSKWLSNRNLGNKYNLGRKHSEESRKNMSLSHIGLPSARLGVEVSQATKDKQSKAKLGKKGNATGFKHTEETKNKKRKPVIQLDLNGNFIKEWIGGREAAKMLRIQESNITLVCKGQRATTGGFKWIFKN